MMETSMEAAGRLSPLGSGAKFSRCSAGYVIPLGESSDQRTPTRW
jgi:hypothetical protein